MSELRPRNPVPASGGGRLKALMREPAKRIAYAAIVQVPVTERIDLVRHGLHPGWITTVASDLGIEQNYLIGNLGLARSTIARKVKEGTALGVRESERVLGLADLVGIVETMAEESGAPPRFDAAAWVGQWIDRPLPALGGRKPIQMLDTAEGQRLVASLLRQSQTGAYA